MKILLNNAYEAWRSAIKYHDKLESGLITLNNQKGFVSSLHNSVELFLKQMMLDNNDHAVVQIKNLDKICKNRNERIDLFRNYLNATDLNEFFTELKNNKPELLNYFYSIEFSLLIEYAKDLMGCMNQNIKSALKLLNNLRNNETHFYIDDDYLKEEDFCLLHNFMTDFYAVLLDKDYICNFSLKNSITNDGVPDLRVIFIVTKHEFMKFTFEKYKSFSYYDSVKSNPLYKILKDKYKETRFESEQEYEEGLHLFWVADMVCSELDIKEDDDNIMSLIKAMDKLKMFRITRLHLGKPVNGDYGVIVEIL